MPRERARGEGAPRVARAARPPPPPEPPETSRRRNHRPKMWAGAGNGSRNRKVPGTFSSPAPPWDSRFHAPRRRPTSCAPPRATRPLRTQGPRDGPPLEPVRRACKGFPRGSARECREPYVPRARTASRRCISRRTLRGPAPGWEGSVRFFVRCAQFRTHPCRALPPPRPIPHQRPPARKVSQDDGQEGGRAARSLGICGGPSPPQVEVRLSRSPASGRKSGGGGDFALDTARVPRYNLCHAGAAPRYSPSPQAVPVR
jgi:hypothetical protein